MRVNTKAATIPAPTPANPRAGVLCGNAESGLGRVSVRLRDELSAGDDDEGSEDAANDSFHDAALSWLIVECLSRLYRVAQRSRRRAGCYRQAQHLDGSVMGHR